jgi:hypothetical protein
MASYFLRSKHISRGKGARVTRAAAYRAGERIRDERTSEVYNYSDRRDVVCKEVVLPADLAGREDMAWTQDRAVLWNAAEHAGARRNSRLAREFLVLLPPELSPAQRVDLVRGFSRQLADKYRGAVDMTVHVPRPGADARNHHAHLLMTVREVGPGGMGPRTALELGGRERRERGLGPTKAEYLAIRKTWAELTNHALQQAGLGARVDHRSYEAQGANREPTPTIPEKVFYAERRSGTASPAGDAIRARHRERLQARVQRQGELERVVAKQERQLRERALGELEREGGEPAKARWGSLTRDERNALRRERYRARRALEQRDPEREARRREVLRRRYQESFRRDPETSRERRRQYRASHAQEINRKQREYRKGRSQELNRRRRELRRLHSAEQDRQPRDDRATRPEPALSPAAGTGPSPTPNVSARAWLADRGRRDLETNGEGSAVQWRSSRDQKSPESTSEDSARAWLAARDESPQCEADRPDTESSRPTGPDKDEDDEDGRRRRRDHDLEI